ncbi:MAG: response regulator [Proteobacteria bacterium]|nr:response regulator [Pseudomonadota bacterium]MBU1714669.1 response regulator [Pseudomonadota bacterium]
MERTTKILIADDDDLVREAVVKILEMYGHEVVSVESGEQALTKLNKEIDVIILDINMPGMDGFETMAAINKKELGVPVLFLTGAGSMEYAVKAINLGAYDFISKPIEDLDLFEVKVRRAIEKRMYVLHEVAYQESLEKEVKAKTKELAEKNELLEEYSSNLEISALNTITTLQVALEEKDQYTAGHTTRVTEYSMMIGKAMDLSKEDMVVLERACRVHDIGKLVIDVSCIQKPGALTDEEWQMIKKHPEIGQNIIKPLDFLERESLIVRHHHERVDGKGYPDGIKGDELDILTKIVTVADSFDAMTSKRSYKVNMALSDGVVELRRCVGSQFDPEVVEIFAKVMVARKGYK